MTRKKSSWCEIMFVQKLLFPRPTFLWADVGGIIVFVTFHFPICFPWQRCVLASLVCFGTPLSPINASSGHNWFGFAAGSQKKMNTAEFRRGVVRPRGEWQAKCWFGSHLIYTKLWRYFFLYKTVEIFFIFFFVVLVVVTCFFRVIIRNSDAIIDIRIVLLEDLWKKNNFLFLITAF